MEGRPKNKLIELLEKMSPADFLRYQSILRRKEREAQDFLVRARQDLVLKVPQLADGYMDIVHTIWGVTDGSGGFWPQSFIFDNMLWSVEYGYSHEAAGSLTISTLEISITHRPGYDEKCVFLKNEGNYKISERLESFMGLLQLYCMRLQKAVEKRMFGPYAMSLYK